MRIVEKKEPVTVDSLLYGNLFVESEEDFIQARVWVRAGSYDRDQTLVMGYTPGLPLYKALPNKQLVIPVVVKHRI